MNVVVVMNDTFRRDHLAAYGVAPPWSRSGHFGEPFIDTPNLDRLSADSAMFERFYCASYPTVPCRYDLFTGRYGFVHRGWQPLEPGDVILSETVAQHGHVPMLIFDPPMLITDSYNYTRGFEGWDFVRGQHQDRYIVDPIPVSLPAALYKMKGLAPTRRYLRNTAHRRTEGDWMCAQTMDRALAWLDRNRTRKSFVLWIDMWDPHEPFDAPPEQVSRYADPGFSGDQIIYPRYGRCDYMSDAERNQVRSLYASLVSVVDRCMGRLLDQLSALRLDQNTLLVFLSDHGHLFGEHGLQGKPSGPLGKLYEVTARVPLLIRHPEGLGAGRKIGSLTQHVDLLPTLLEALDIPVPATVQGHSLLPLLKGESVDLRDAAISGRYSSRSPNDVRIQATPAEGAAYDGAAGIAVDGDPITVTTERWSYLCPASGGGGRELYDLETDPNQTLNVIDEHPDSAHGLHGRLLDFLVKTGADSRRIDSYRPEDEAPQTALLPPELQLFTLCGERGEMLAFPARGEAEQCATGPLEGQAIKPTTLGSLRASDPRALVHLDAQYYWAEDLL